MLSQLLQYKRVTQTIESISLNDHVCLFYETQEEQFKSIIPFIRKAIIDNHSSAYISDENSVSTSSFGTIP